MIQLIKTAVNKFLWFTGITCPLPEPEKTAYTISCEKFHAERKKLDKETIRMMDRFCRSRKNKITLNPEEQTSLHALVHQACYYQKPCEDHPDIRKAFNAIVLAGTNPHGDKEFYISDNLKKVLPWVLRVGFDHGHYSPYW